MINCDRISPQARVQRDRLTERKEKYFSSLLNVCGRLYMYPSSTSAQCRGVRGECTELNLHILDISGRIISMSQQSPIEVLREINQSHKKAGVPSFTEAMLAEMDGWSEGSNVLARAAYQLFYNRLLLVEKPDFVLANVRQYGGLPLPIANDLHTNPRPKNILTSVLYVRDGQALSMASAVRVYMDNALKSSTPVTPSLLEHGYYDTMKTKIKLPPEMADLLRTGFTGLFLQYPAEFVSMANALK